MKMSDISMWANSETRRIEITLGICQEPFAVTVRKFVPMKGDSLERSWYDGPTRKSKMIEPYGMARMSAAAVDFQRYIDANAFQCMEHVLAGSDVLIQETYAMATRHFKSAQASIFALVLPVLMLTNGADRGREAIDAEPISIVVCDSPHYGLVVASRRRHARNESRTQRPFIPSLRKGSHPSRSLVTIRHNYYLESPAAVAKDRS
jgi:hypothetical protein